MFRKEHSQKKLFLGISSDNCKETVVNSFLSDASCWIAGNTWTSPRYYRASSGSAEVYYNKTFLINSATTVSYSQYHERGGVGASYINFSFYNASDHLISSVRRNGDGNGSVTLPSGTRKLVINGYACDSTTSSTGCQGHHSFSIN